MDRVFSQWLRHAYADEDGTVECYTCRVKKPVKEMQAGHFMSRSYHATRWTVPNVMPQCPKCNLFEQGRQYDFGVRLDQDFGEGTAEGLRIKSKQIKHYTAAGLKDIRQHLQAELDDLRK